GEPDPKQTQPCPKHVALIQTSDATIAGEGRRRSGKAIAKSADQMPQRVTTKCVTAKQDDVDREHDRADADPKSIVEPERFPNVVGKNHNKTEREVKKITVHVLQDQRERAFAEVSFARLADGAGRRIGPEGFIISAAIIVAGEPKTARRP